MLLGGATAENSLLTALSSHTLLPSPPSSLPLTKSTSSDRLFPAVPVFDLADIFRLLAARAAAAAAAPCRSTRTHIAWKRMQTNAPKYLPPH